MYKTNSLRLTSMGLNSTGLVLILLLFSSIAFGDVSKESSKKNGKGQNPKESLSKKNSVKVTVKHLSELLISLKNSAPATIVSLNHAVLGAQISGKVIKVKVKTGDIVAKNALLLEIECNDYTLARKQTKAALESAKAQAALAAKQYTRNLQLRRIKSIPQNLLDESILQTQVARADIAVKKAALQQSQLAIERCKIKAPYAGQITERMVSEGQLLAPNSPVFKLLQTRALEIRAELTPSEVASAKQASGLFYRRGEQQIAVKFRSVIDEVMAGSRTLQARLVPDESDALVVGFSGRLEWIGKRSMLPAEYIIRRNGSLGVMVFERGSKVNKAVFHPLPDAKEGQAAFTRLPSTTQVIVSNRFRLKVNQVVDLE
ncbi:MAG: efflux RND transporter periplasmic adaptor subunit [Thiotrichaceae bacterium]